MNPPPRPLPPHLFPNSSSFTFLPPQTPNPNFVDPHHHRYHHPSPTTTSTTAATVPSPPPHNPPDLAAALSELKSFIHLSETTITSISSILPTATSTVTCPFNSYHRIPPESLFIHSLRCPSSPSPISLSSLSTSDYFYKDCPAVVTLPPKGITSSCSTNQAHNLPVILSNSLGETQKGCSTDCQIRFLPSEILLIKRETEAWNDYPFMYSHTICRAILCFSSDNCRKELAKQSSTWAIVNSPCYGVVIDVPMRDHIFLLFRLCLRAITSEAIGLVDTDMNEFSLKCPVLGQGLMWFGNQLSILYGETNGKLFAIHMFKQLLLNAATNSSLIFSEHSVESSRGNCNLIDGSILVSQVEAAVVAIHERSLLQEKIKAIWYPSQLSNPQRIAEHEYVSKRADEERQKCPDYRPILEHDGFLWQRALNQENNVMKSREELLAEERDYKRRRMSYRGKKMKRTTTQVMRDIIEEYMDNIKSAGGSDCTLDEAEEAGKIASEPFPVHDVRADNVTDKELNYSSEVSCGRSHKSMRSTRRKDVSPEDFKRPRRDSRRPHENLDDQNDDRNKHDREYYYSRSPNKQRVNDRSREHSSARGQRDEAEMGRKYYP